MREIRFRGKTKDDNEWVEGSYVYAHKYYGTGEDGYLIYNIYGCNKVLVNKDTLGQFTGLYDKKSKRIFEGDILKYKYICGYDNTQLDECIGIVYFNEKTCIFCIHYKENGFECNDFFEDILEYEVIGNIWDNPELKER